jgi:SWI/SNF-related matrix-associated actin-dependent regulator of chromatin subfamily A-like protein 1
MIILHIFFVWMLDINKLKNKKTLFKLKEYEGNNEYLISLKNKFLKEGSFSISPSTAEYIERNFHKDPLNINRVVKITEYFGKQLQETYHTKFVPERIFIETVLGDTDKTYHVKGKIFQNQKYSPIFYIPKSQVYENLMEVVVDVDVNFEKFEELDKRKRILYQHQKEGVKFLLSREKTILADDMGLGKTLMSVIASIESGVDKILIVCPSSPKINWFRELSCFIPEEQISIISGKKWVPKKYTIINYDILKNFHTLVDNRKKYDENEINRDIVNENFDLIILDESHMVKNPTTGRTKIINEISKTIKKRWLLTGTPIANRPMDYYNLLKICESTVTTSWQYYAFRYCDAKKFKKKLKSGKVKDIWLTDGASNLEELHDRTKNIMLRRKKEDHLDLPPKIVSPYYVDIDNMDAYNNAFKDYLEWAKAEGKKVGSGRHMVELVVLRKFLAEEKTKHTISLTEEALESGKKVIIFTNFTHSFDILMKHFGSIAVGHNGKLSEKQKQNSVDKFQTDPNTKVFVGNLISAGSAITLTEAEVVIMNDLDFVPSNHAQAEDRAYRISQTKTVNVYYPIVVNTIDEMIYDMLQEKKRIINTIVGDNHVEVDISRNFLSNLLGLDFSGLDGEV